MGFEVSGINHQDLWPWDIGCRQPGKDQIKNTGNYIPRLTKPQGKSCRNQPRVSQSFAYGLLQ